MSAPPGPSPTAGSPGAPVLLLIEAPTENEPLTGAGYTPADPVAPHLRVDDLGASRGDGVFETIGVFDGQPRQLEPHLARFARSAALLGLPAPRLEVWRAAVLEAIETAGPSTDLAVKIVLTRGVEGAQTCTGWLLASAIANMDAARSDGVRVVTLDRGYASDVAVTSPWLLQGAKYTSYAVNMAALREARRQGADDAIFLSSDGFVLEAPTATVVLREGDTLITPATDQGILPGTTQEEVFAFAAARGLRTHARPVPESELRAATQVWLCSSVRLCAPVRSIDGRPLDVDQALTADLLTSLRTGS